MKNTKIQPVGGLPEGASLKKEMKQSKLLFLFNFGSILCLIVIFAALGITTIQSRKADKMNHERFLLTECATYFIDASSYLTSEVRAYATTGDKIHYNNYMNELEQFKTREMSVAKMKEIGITAKEQEQIDQMMALSNSLVPLEEKALKDVSEGDKKAAVLSVLGPDYNNVVTRIHEQKLEFLNSLAVRTSAEVNHGVAVTRAMEMSTVVLLIIIIAFQVFCYRLSRKRVIEPIIAVEREMRNLAQGKLSEPFPYQPNTSEMGMMIESILSMRWTLKRYIGDISEKLTRMAAKDMTVRVEIDYIGDFVPIKDAMNTIILSMNDVLKHLRDSADHVASESSEVSLSSQGLAAGIVQQASALAEITNSMVQISEQIESNSTQAKMATGLANAAGVKLGQSNEHLQEMLKAMKEINDASGEISKIVKTIEDIAMQTNLLALNAAVEAARAGSAGESFAVVADEVRALANKSAQASKNTSVMIENSLKTIQSGAEIAQEASNTFEEVIINAGKAAEAMGMISITAEKQFEVFGKLTANVEQISAAVQQHSSVSEESARVSEQLDTEAEELRKIAAQFHLQKIDRLNQMF